MDTQIRTFLNCLRVEKGLADNTIQAYRRDIEKFAAFTHGRKLAAKDIQRSDVVDFLATLYSDSYVLSLVRMGEVPVTTNTKSLLSQSTDPAYSNFLYDLVAGAPAFTQSWDQALGSTLATPMLTEIQKLFNGQDSPQQFVSNVLAIQS